MNDLDILYMLDDSKLSPIGIHGQEMLPEHTSPGLLKMLVEQSIQCRKSKMEYTPIFYSIFEDHIVLIDYFNQDVSKLVDKIINEIYPELFVICHKLPIYSNNSIKLKCLNGEYYSSNKYDKPILFTMYGLSPKYNKYSLTNLYWEKSPSTLVDIVAELHKGTFDSTFNSIIKAIRGHKKIKDAGISVYYKGRCVDAELKELEAGIRNGSVCDSCKNSLLCLVEKKVAQHKYFSRYYGCAMHQIDLLIDKLQIQTLTKEYLLGFSNEDVSIIRQAFLQGLHATKYHVDTSNETVSSELVHSCLWQGDGNASKSYQEIKEGTPEFKLLTTVIKACIRDASNNLKRYVLDKYGGSIVTHGLPEPHTDEDYGARYTKSYTLWPKSCSLNDAVSAVFQQQHESNGHDIIENIVSRMTKVDDKGFSKIYIKLPGMFTEVNHLDISLRMRQFVDFMSAEYASQALPITTKHLMHVEAFNTIKLTQLILHAKLLFHTYTYENDTRLPTFDQLSMTKLQTLLRNADTDEIYVNDSVTSSLMEWVDRKCQKADKCLFGKEGSCTIDCGTTLICTNKEHIIAKNRTPANNKRPIVLQCKRAITSVRELIQNGVDVVYNKLTKKFPTLDSAIEKLAVYIVDYLGGNITAGSGYQANMSSVLFVESDDSPYTGLRVQRVGLHIKQDGNVIPIVTNVGTNNSALEAYSQRNACMLLYPTAPNTYRDNIVKMAEGGQPSDKVYPIFRDSYLLNNVTIESIEDRYSTIKLDAGQLLCNLNYYNAATEVDKNEVMIVKQLIIKEVVSTLLPIAHPGVINGISGLFPGLLTISKEKLGAEYTSLVCIDIYRDKEGANKDTYSTIDLAWALHKQTESGPLGDTISPREYRAGNAYADYSIVIDGYGRKHLIQCGVTKQTTTLADHRKLTTAKLAKHFYITPLDVDASLIYEKPIGGGVLFDSIATPDIVKLILYGSDIIGLLSMHQVLNLDNNCALGKVSIVKHKGQPLNNLKKGSNDQIIPVIPSTYIRRQADVYRDKVIDEIAEVTGLDKSLVE